MFSFSQINNNINLHVYSVFNFLTNVIVFVTITPRYFNFSKFSKDKFIPYIEIIIFNIVGARWLQAGQPGLDSKWQKGGDFYSLFRVQTYPEGLSASFKMNRPTGTSLRVNTALFRVYF